MFIICCFGISPLDAIQLCLRLQRPITDSPSRRSAPACADLVRNHLGWVGEKNKHVHSGKKNKQKKNNPIRVDADDFVLWYNLSWHNSSVYMTASVSADQHLLIAPRCVSMAPESFKASSPAPLWCAALIFRPYVDFYFFLFSGDFPQTYSDSQPVWGDAACHFLHPPAGFLSF